MKNGTTPPAAQQELVSWVHFGDLHMTTRDQQNYRDFLALVDEVNRIERGILGTQLGPNKNGRKW
jgi:hypothetical protein